MKIGRSFCYLTATFFFVADFFGFAPCPVIHAQTTVISAPFFRFGDSSFEDVGFGFGQPSGDTGTGARLGFSILRDGAALNFSFTAVQGSSRSMVGAAPSVVVSNGGFGTFQHVIQRPFVVGFIPVVGGWSNGIVVPPRIPSFSLGSAISPLQDRVQRLANGEVAPAITARQKASETDETVSGIESRSTARRSTAEQPDISVAQIQRQRDAKDGAREATIAGHVAEARQAEAAGDLSRAVKLFDKARREARGTQRRAYEDKIRALRARIRAAQSK